MTDPIKFDEYKMFIEDTARFTERRQNASNLYVTIHSLLLTAIVFVIKDLGANKASILMLLAPIVIAGIFVSIWWGQLIEKYKALVGLRIDTLREMENDERLVGIAKMYHTEDRLYPRDKDGKTIQLPGKFSSFSDLENRLPMLFIALYLVVGGILIFNFSQLP